MTAEKISYESVDVFSCAPEEVDLDDNVVATYYVESRSSSLRAAGVEIAAEESIGTWTEMTLAKHILAKNLQARVFEAVTENGNMGVVKIAFPLDLFDYETGGIPNLLSIVAGNLFGISTLNNIRLLHLRFPKKYVSAFKGPKFGIEGVRRLIGTTESRRPHVGTIIKPKVGLDPEETARVAYEAASGGVDFIKDDETLTNQRFCPLEDRVSKVVEALDRVKEETGRTVLYSPDITAEVYGISELADRAIENGAPALMVDVITAGYSAVRLLAEDPSVKVPLHVHRCMHAAMTRNPKHGIAMMIIAELVRLAGGDQVHTGTAAGKMGGAEKEIEEIKGINDFLRGKFYGLKTVFPVASGGIHPGIVPLNIETLGKDIVIQAGGGIHGHPSGTRAGAMAMRQVVDATMKGVSVQDYAEDHDELKAALNKWGFKYAKGN
jgi:ribulose-bisphosphate carboxylase large chain